MMNLTNDLLALLGNPMLEQMSLYLIHAMIGFLFGMSLVYMMRNGPVRKRRATVLLLILGFYLGTWLLGDHTFVRRILQVFALTHVTMAGILIIRKSMDKKVR